MCFLKTTDSPIPICETASSASLQSFPRLVYLEIEDSDREFAYYIMGTENTGEGSSDTSSSLCREVPLILSIAQFELFAVDPSVEDSRNQTRQESDVVGSVAHKWRNPRRYEHNEPEPEQAEPSLRPRQLRLHPVVQTKPQAEENIEKTR